MRPLDRLASLKLKLGLVIVAAVVTTLIVNELGLQYGFKPASRAVVAALLALAMVQLLARGMISPLREMATASRAMARGEHGRRVTATSNDEVGELARAFNVMSAELEEVDRIRRDLVANVSHELRTPISALQAVLENLIDGVEPADPERFRTMLKQVERLGRLVTQLLDLSRLESGVVPLQRRRFAVRELLDDAADEARLRSLETPIEVEVEPPGLTLDADPERVHQVVANLVENAVRHSPPGAAVKIQAHANGARGTVVVEVSDAGPGIADEDAGRVFERFYRSDAARASRDGGAGLGLAIARWIVDLHGGTIRPERRQPTGCRMVVELPARATALTSDGGIAGVPAATAARATSTAAHADDEPDVRADAHAGAATHAAIDNDARAGRAARTTTAPPASTSRRTTTMSITDAAVPSGPPPTTGPATTSTPWPDVMTVEPADTRVLIAIAAAAVGVDLGVRSEIAGIAGALLPVVVVAGMFATGRVTNRRAWPILFAVPLIGAWLVARMNWLLPLDILAAASLLVVGASFARDGDPLDLTIPGAIGRGLHALTHGVLGIGFPFTALRGRGNLAVVRGIALGAPLLLVLGMLLGSADPVFASFFHLPDDFADVILHAVLLGIGAWGAAGLLRMASAPSYDVRPATSRPLGRVEAVTVLGGVVAIFAAFTVSQLITVIGGADYVRRTAGLTYAEYARNGFFQLLAVVVITLGVLLAVRATVEDPSHRPFLILSEVAVVLTLLLVAGAVRRLGLYEQAYGLTSLRLVSSAFAVWIGIVFVLLGVSLTGRVRPDKQWFVPVAAAIAVVGLFGLNAINPDAWIVRRNVERFGMTDKLDVEHLVGLSDDAVPALLDARDGMSPEAAALVEERVCAGERRADGGFWAFNASRDAAIEARNAACPAPEERD